MEVLRNHSQMSAIKGHRPVGCYRGLTASSMRIVFLWASATVLAAISVAYAGDKKVLRFVGKIPMDGVEGGIDHIAASADGRRLFVAALGSDMVAEIDTKRRKLVGTIRGIKEPQGVCYIAKSNKLAVASGGDGKVRIYDHDSKLLGSVDSLDDADNIRYDSASNLLYVGYGQGALAIIDPDKVLKVAEIPLDGHPESFQLERKDNRIFVNVPTADEIEILDREKRLVLTRWKLTTGHNNFPMALDETNQRLFVGTRKPARLLALDATSGEVVANLRACGDTDDLFYDSVNRKIYLSGGAGCVSAFDQADSNTYEELHTISTPSGARTSLFAADSRTMYVAAPHRGSQKAEILILKAAAAARLRSDAELGRAG
jgi:outer membrane protein assembly factor BamB